MEGEKEGADEEEKLCVCVCLCARMCLCVHCTEDTLDLSGSLL